MVGDICVIDTECTGFFSVIDCDERAQQAICYPSSDRTKSEEATERELTFVGMQKMRGTDRRSRRRRKRDELRFG